MNKRLTAMLKQARVKKNVKAVQHSESKGMRQKIQSPKQASSRNRKYKYTRTKDWEKKDWNVSIQPVTKPENEGRSRKYADQNLNKIM